MDDINNRHRALGIATPAEQMAALAEGETQTLQERQKAYSRLCCAASEMLAALKAARSRMADIGCCYGQGHYDFDLVCDAIAKAEGTEP